jgi:ferritin-like metal-binding protein YciE
MQPTVPGSEAVSTRPVTEITTPKIKEALTVRQGGFVRNRNRPSAITAQATHFRRTIMAHEKNLRELFHETLKDIYFAEKKILGALPKMAKAAQTEELKAAFEKHEIETEEHVNRLEKVFEEIDAAPRGKTCDAIMGIIEEGQEVMKEFKGMPALDAGLLAAAQAVEHYEIARYGTLRTWAGELGLDQSVKLLNATLDEEKKTDEALTKLAQSAVNQHAKAA